MEPWCNWISRGPENFSWVDLNFLLKLQRSFSKFRNLYGGGCHLWADPGSPLMDPKWNPRTMWCGRSGSTLKWRSRYEISTRAASCNQSSYNYTLLSKYTPSFTNGTPLFLFFFLRTSNCTHLLRLISFSSTLLLKISLHLNLLPISLLPHALFQSISLLDLGLGEWL